MYNVNSYNNVLFYDAGLSVTVPQAQYTVTEFMDELIVQFAAEAPAITMTYTIDLATSKIEMTFTAPIILQGSSAGTTMACLIGLDGSADTASLAVQTMPNHYDFSGLKKVYIGSNTLTTGTSMSSSSKEHYKIFTEIPIIVPYGQSEKRTLTDLHTIDQVTHSVPFNISNIDITLYDQDLNVAELNGLDIYIVLVALAD
jgi:hypothetical protein